MKFKPFIIFVGPSILMMILFISVPLVTVFWQSFNLTQKVYEEVEVETCIPGFLKPKCTIEFKLNPIFDNNGRPITKTDFVGFQSYKRVLEPELFIDSIKNKNWNDLMSLDFWKALRFTLTFTLITLPLILTIGMALALAVNNTIQSIRGPVIFISLLPFIITPVIGALSIRWLFIGDGILTAGLEWWVQRDISMFAQGWTIEIMMYIYRVWHVVPFAFIVLYAGLQTVNQDLIESAIIDGSNRFQRLRYIIIPHLIPLIVFIILIHLMDAYRVFDEIIGFSSEAHIISLQWLTYDYLMPDDTGNRSISRASASAMLTMVGIILLLVIPLRQTWLAEKEK